jgi:hypothetical protein
VEQSTSAVGSAENSPCSANQHVTTIYTAIGGWAY